MGGEPCRRALVRTSETASSRSSTTSGVEPVARALARAPCGARARRRTGRSSRGSWRPWAEGPPRPGRRAPRSGSRNPALGTTDPRSRRPPWARRAMSRRTVRQRGGVVRAQQVDRSPREDEVGRRLQPAVVDQLGRGASREHLFGDDARADVGRRGEVVEQDAVGVPLGLVGDGLVDEVDGVRVRAQLRREQRHAGRRGHHERPLSLLEARTEEAAGLGRVGAVAVVHQAGVGRRHAHGSGLTAPP